MPAVTMPMITSTTRISTSVKPRAPGTPPPARAPGISRRRPAAPGQPHEIALAVTEEPAPLRKTRNFVGTPLVRDIPVADVGIDAIATGGAVSSQAEEVVLLTM